MGSIHERVNIGVGVLVHDQEGNVLLGKRLGKHGAGEYSTPGGKPDPGESPSKAACRELWEETGIYIPPDLMTPLDFWTYDVFESHEMHFVTLYFECVCPPVQIPENLEPEKCEGWYWFPPGNPPQPLFSGVGRALAHIAK